VLALAVTSGVAADRALSRRQARETVETVTTEDLRDAVASPTAPATAGLAGRPVPTTWFMSPAQHRIQVDTALFASRRRRMLAQRVAAR
jgi:hypothetical protein